jgi:hypothetical protein
MDNVDKLEKNFDKQCRDVEIACQTKLDNLDTKYRKLKQKLDQAIRDKCLLEACVVSNKDNTAKDNND